MINVNRDPNKGHAVSAQEIHPFRTPEPLTDEEKRERLKESFAALKESMFKGESRIIAPFVPENVKRLTHGGSGSNPSS